MFPGQSSEFTDRSDSVRQRIGVVVAAKASEHGLTELLDKTVATVECQQRGWPCSISH